MTPRQFILKALHRMDGTPFEDRLLRDSSHLVFQGKQAISETELGGIIRDLEVEGYISGHHDAFDKKLRWVLTAKGTAQAAQLP